MLGLSLHVGGGEFRNDPFFYAESGAVVPRDGRISVGLALFLRTGAPPAYYPVVVSRRHFLEVEEFDFMPERGNLARKPGGDGISGGEIVEKAVHLLRGAPATVYTPYLLGVCPFLLGFLFFWADMSRSALAYRHCSAAAFGLAVLFLWMKCWQAIFSARLRAHLCGAVPSRWPLKRILGLIRTQAIWQTTGILVLLLAGMILIPFGWAYAFYQNLTVLEEHHPVAEGSSVERASKQAVLRPAQNHVIISILSLFSLFVLINWVSALLAGPYLLKTVFGWETVFTRSGFSLFNTTFLAICIVLTFVAVEPVVKAVYLLRCYYGEAQQSGLDLKIALR